jgi:hypothetical protein
VAEHLADSLRRVVEQRNELITYITNHPETIRTIVRDTLLVPYPGPVDVRVRNQLSVADSGWDIAGVLAVPIIIAAVTMWGTFRAAKVGAQEGARLAQESGMAMLGEERRLEREHALERLRRRVESNLGRVRALSGESADHDPKEPLDADIGERLEVIWNLYYRVFEPIFQLGDADLAEAIDSFFVKLHTMAVEIARLESLGSQASFGAPDTPEWMKNYKVRERVVADRTEVIRELSQLGPEAEALLERVQALPRPRSAAEARAR